MNTLNRYDWLKAVMQAEGLTPSTKNVATAIAVQFANDETGQTNPSQSTLADYLKVHIDTIKRAFREMRKAGWLLVAGCGGRSIVPHLHLRAPGNIVPFRSRKGGADGHETASERGGKSSSLSEKKGGQFAAKGGANYTPALEQSKNIKGRGRERSTPHIPKPAILDRWKDHRFVGSAFTGLSLVPSTDYGSLNRWTDWLDAENLPRPCNLPVKQEAKNGAIFFNLPSKLPPTCEAGRLEARAFFEAVMDWEASRHAAQ